MTSELVDLPQSLLRLDQLLAEAGEDAMVLPELDGFLCGLVVSPEPVALEEWWPLGWLADERGQIAAANEELAGLIQAHLAEIEREFAEQDYAPLFEVDDETEEVVWETWMIGFQQAMHLRFEAWDELLRHTGEDMRGEAAMRLAPGLMLLQPDLLPDDTAGDEEWAEYDAAMAEMPENLAIMATLLYRLHRQN